MPFSRPIATITPINKDAEPTAIQRLSRDLAAASASLSIEEVGYLVKAYYAWQEKRKESDNQKRTLVEDHKPHAVIAWMVAQEETMENQIKRSLDKFTDHHPVGKWMKSIHGIGPVIAAGILAHIDIEKAPTAGHIWRYAGLDPTVSWLSKEVVTKTINEHCDEFGQVAASEGARESRMTELRRIVDLDFELDIDDVTKLKRMPGNLRQLSDEYQSLLNFDPEALKGLRKNQRYVDRDTVRWCCSHFGRNYDTLIRYMSDKETGELKLTVTSLANAVVRRPWNGELKVLCWKAGQSFMKTHNNENSVYGHLYAQQKLKYQNKNANGEFAERAARELNDYDPSTEAYGHLKQGRLPPANIDGMARRWAVKIFLSHVHHVMYWHKFKSMPPKPFAIAHLEHAHMITVPTPAWAPFQ